MMKKRLLVISVVGAALLLAVFVGIERHRRVRKSDSKALDLSGTPVETAHPPLDREKEQDVEDTPSAPTRGKAKISGTASFRERLALLPGAVFVATLEDVSRADAKAEVLGEARIDPAGNPPYAFEIEYDPNKIDERHTYTVRAKIVVGDKLAFTTDTHYPVLTRGAGEEVEILLKRARDR